MAGARQGVRGPVGTRAIWAGALLAGRVGACGAGHLLSWGFCLLLCGIPGQVNAVCGVGTRSPAEIFAASDAVFIGTALRVWVIQEEFSK